MQHRFFHADRMKALSQGQIIEPDPYGLSRFGLVYIDAIRLTPREQRSDAEQREFLLEQIRAEPKFSNYASRLSCLFGTGTIEEAITFANQIEPRPTHDVPIFEVFAERFWHLDTNWLDYECDELQRLQYLREYWCAAISNHCPESGPRRPPRIEVLLELPVKVGNIVGWAVAA